MLATRFCVTASVIVPRRSLACFIVVPKLESSARHSSHTLGALPPNFYRPFCSTSVGSLGAPGDWCIVLPSAPPATSLSLFKPTEPTAHGPNPCFDSTPKSGVELEIYRQPGLRATRTIIGRTLTRLLALLEKRLEDSDIRYVVGRLVASGDRGGVPAVSSAQERVGR